MKSILEFAARHVEPSLKRSLAIKLLARGVDRGKVSTCLGISPALLTRYIKGERGLHDFTRIKDVDERLDKLAEEVASGRKCGLDAYTELLNLTFYVLYKKYACGIHYVATRDVNPAKCNACPALFGKLFE